MKKIMIAAAIIFAAVVSQAAAVNWEGFDITDINGDLYTGSATLFCVEVAGISSSGTIVDAELYGDLVDDATLAEGEYHFYFTSTDAAGNTYKSEIVAASALGTGAGVATFEGGGTWTAAAVPEPTSGLLLLLGVAGLALKRKRA